MKIFGYFERKDPYGHYGNAPEVPEQPATEVAGTGRRSGQSETHNTLDEDVAVERAHKKALRRLAIAFCILMSLLLLAVLCSCKQTEYVPVIETRDVHHWHTDSVKEKDSTYHEKTTIIQQLDSAEMARYGIQLKSAERAWLVKTAELERQIEQLMAMSATKDSVHDSVPVPYPVKEYVAKPLSGWQWFQIWAGRLVLIALALAAAVVVVRRFFLRSPLK